MFVPYALPGETVLAEVDGERGRLIAVGSPRSIASRRPARLRDLRRLRRAGVRRRALRGLEGGLVAQALAQAKLDTRSAPLVAAHGEGRRRVTFHARGRGTDGSNVASASWRRAHDIIDPRMPVLTPALAGAPRAAQAIANALAARQAPRHPDHSHR